MLNLWDKSSMLDGFRKTMFNNDALIRFPLTILNLVNTVLRISMALSVIGLIDGLVTIQVVFKLSG